MLIVSWNVAGLKPALQRIHSDYCGGGGGGGDIVRNDDDNNCTAASSTMTTSTMTTTKRRSSSSTSSNDDHPFSTFLRRHGSIDVLCLQEHKIPHKSLSDRSEPHRCADIPGYESYWGCVTDTKSKGFNGVVTYAKSGTVRRADRAPLQNVELDGQGRCIMTDHGHFVVFNVYVPCGGGCERTLTRKMAFLRALRNAMDRQRRVHGKKVVLVGDMNIKIDKRDVHWEYLLVNVDTVVTDYRRHHHRLRQSQQEEEEEASQQQSLQKKNEDDLTIEEEKEEWDNMKWVSDVERHWQMIERTLETTLVAIPRQTTNPSSGAKFDKFRARIELPLGSSLASGTTKAKKFVMLGDNEDTPEEALSYYNFAEQSYIDEMTGIKVVLRKKNLLSIQILSELMSKICNINWDESTRKNIAMSKYANLNLDSPPLRWMQELLVKKDDDDGGGGIMVDIFRHFYPTAEGRYTCWNQFTQMRYTNMGGRIDYTLVDKSLMEYVERPPPDGRLLRCGGGRDDNDDVSPLLTNNGERRKKHVDPLSATAALMAATACGLFESGSFAGGGIASATKRALDTQFVGVPHSGMIYTPPSYSDHIAVSLLLKDDITLNHHTIDSSNKLELMNDASTRKTQPHKRQRSISSFFSSGGTSTAASTSLSSMTFSTVLQPDAGVKRQHISSSEDTSKANEPPKKKGLYSFFGKSNTVKE